MSAIEPTTVATTRLRSTTPRPRWQAAAEAALIALISLALLTQCWDADFINYDDVMHIQIVPEIYGKAPLLNLFRTPSDTYIPITYCSYRLDYVLFGQWLLSHGHNWAPAVRGMTWVYHAGASLALWRILLLLGVGEFPALFIALVFAVHPTACETVSWISERKNALAAFFGFSALWSFLALEGRWQRVPVTFALFALALLSKPSALGLLPIFGVIELFHGAAGMRGERPLRWRPDASWLGIAARIAPLAAVAAFALQMNLHGQADSLVSPPGGSLFTAILTDTDVLLRYGVNLLAPFWLSIAYYVEPIVSVLDPRLIGYGAIIATFAGATIYFARNRSMAVFGWIWFFAALIPSLNLVAIPYFMQDRYVYLSLPGFFLALTEGVLGLRSRIEVLTPELTRTVAGAFLCMLMAVSMLRSALYQDAFFLFQDAVAKQPLSGFAHYGMIDQYYAAIEGVGLRAQNVPENSVERAHFEDLVNNERLTFLMKCPDATLQIRYTTIAMNQGERYFLDKNWSEAERWLRVAAYPAPKIFSNNRTRATALRDLATLKLSQNLPDDAYALAEEALKLDDYADRSHFLRGKAALARAEIEEKAGHAPRALELRHQARDDFASVPEKSEVYAQARKLLDSIEK